MKKVLTATVIVLLSVFAFAGRTDYRNTSMGMLKSAIDSSELNSFLNPAFIFFEDDTQVSLSGSLNCACKGEIPLIKNSGLSATFLGKKILLNFDLDGYPVKQPDGLYNLYRSFDIEAKLAMGYGPFSVGAGFKGGSSSVRTSVSLENRIFSGLIGEAFFTRYTRQADSYQIEISAGLAYKYRGFSAGLLCENIFEDSSVSKFEVTRDSVLKSIDGGLYWTREPYGKRGKLNRNIFSVGVELQKIWSDSERTLNGGFEYMYQISRDFNVSLRLGTQYLFSDITQSIQTAGLAFGFNKGEFSVMCTTPYTIYTTGDVNLINLGFAFNLVI